MIKCVVGEQKTAFRGLSESRCAARKGAAEDVARAREGLKLGQEQKREEAGGRGSGQAEVVASLLVLGLEARRTCHSGLGRDIT